MSQKSMAKTLRSLACCKLLRCEVVLMIAAFITLSIASAPSGGPLQSAHGLSQSPHLVSQSLLATCDIRCILSDVDGTLLSSEANKHQLSKRTFTAIAAVIDSGYPFFPCTGRSRHSMAAAAPEIVNLFGGDVEKVPGVYQQGLQVYGPTGLLIHEKFLGFSEINDVERFCDLHGVALIAYADQKIFCKKRCDQTDKIGTYSEPPPDVYSSGLGNLGEIGIKVHKLILLADEADLLRVRPLLSDFMKQSVTLTKAVPGMLEVLPLGSSKGEGVAILLNHVGMLPEHVMAFGDGENDVEMFSLVKFGVAVDNAKDILKKVAQAVTLSNDEDGVAEVLEMFLKNKMGSAPTASAPHTM